MRLSFSEFVPSDPQADVWDVVVIGTGAGGGTAGFELARHGRTVLFLERGKLLGLDPTVVRGPRDLSHADAWTPDAAIRHGWWPARVYEKSGGVEYARLSPFGCGTGGTTGVFSMVMDRLRPVDFNSGRCFSDPDSTLPDAWPVSYADLEPYYQEAEALYRVCGTADPVDSDCSTKLLMPPAPSEMETLLLRNLGRAGLHPYRIHYAREWIPECTGCFASLCPHLCRIDSARACVEPALGQHGARILPDCQVLRLETRARAVRSAICHWDGREVVIRAKVFVLAANAFFTPALLQRSATDKFSKGLANSSGMLGRNLMFHASDYMLAHSRTATRSDGRMIHGVSLNDFYVQEDAKLGNIHAHCSYGPVDTPVPSATVFATIVEDLPYSYNRVMARSGSDEEVVWEYVRAEELRERCQLLIQRFSAAIKSNFEVTHPPSVGAPNLAHACGTCRFGNDPESSVLDRNNRAHDLDNLYVVDASFFPSSGGIQPSLTIAANSLRVSREISGRL